MKDITHSIRNMLSGMLEGKVKVKVKLSLCLTKHHIIKMYCRMEV